MMSDPKLHAGFDERPSSWADALKKVTFDDLLRYPGQLVAVSLCGEGVIAGAESIEELAQEVQRIRGEGYQYAIASGALPDVVSAVNKVPSE